MKGRKLKEQAQSDEDVHLACMKCNTCIQGYACSYTDGAPCCACTVSISPRH